MTAIVVELYTALKSAGAPEDQAQAAATVLAERSSTDILRQEVGAIRRDLEEIKIRLAGIEGRFGLVDGRFGNVEGKIVGLEGRFSGLDAQMQTLKWMMGVAIAGVVALIIKSFFPG